MVSGTKHEKRATRAKTHVSHDGATALLEPQNDVHHTIYARRLSPGNHGHRHYSASDHQRHRPCQVLFCFNRSQKNTEFGIKKLNPRYRETGTHSHRYRIKNQKLNSRKTLHAKLRSTGRGLLVGFKRRVSVSASPAKLPPFFCILQLDTPHAPRPHNKANLCCTTLQVAGCELHMSGRNPFYLLAEEQYKQFKVFGFQ